MISNKFIFYLIIIIFLLSKNTFSLSKDYKFTLLKKDLNSPWSISFIDENEIIISEKTGKIKLLNLINDNIVEINHNLNVIEDNNSQGGLLEILYHDNNIYISYAEKRGDFKLYGPSSTSIAKAKFNKEKLNFKNLFRANPPIRSPYHFGSRMVIKGNHLYASVGERGKGMIAQETDKHPGSIIRINLDGSIPFDNPKFINQPKWLPEMYQIGVRNPQGMALSSFDNKIYVSNHGARGGDWFGEVKKGENYGWKILGWDGKNYNMSKIGPKWLPGYTKAIKYWVPSIATSAITIYKGDEFPEFEGLALITSLKSQSLISLNFSNLENVIEKIIFEKEIGRIRDIKIHPKNGKIYLLAQDKLWLFEKN
ncbi:PQQ-dependent sugar dehydrogenase [Pelagibacteraceae bacterium]|nr:PQQ-dependent sugar dehydrogenase [Pelagibacteraceae bacterium]